MVEIDFGRAFGQLRDKPKVIRMNVGDEKIRLPQIHAEFLQGRLHGLQAFRAVHARIDDEKLVSASDRIRVNGF
jgi:hypothetical protein